MLGVPPDQHRRARGGQAGNFAGKAALGLVQPIARVTRLARADGVESRVFFARIGHALVR